MLGLMAMMMSTSHLVPLTVSWIYDDGMIAVFAFSMVLNFAVGYLAWLGTRHHQVELEPRDGFLLVSLAWMGGAAFATVPLLGGIAGLSFTDAYFEAASGLTTTGATGPDQSGHSTRVAEPVAPRASVVRRHGHNCSCCGNPPPAGRGGHADIQGGDAWSNEGHKTHAAYPRDCEKSLANLCRHYRGLRNQPEDRGYVVV